jgi:Na+-translocating ferredoxin:NAD+ oxidoreductase RNF subunit RnfB
MKGSLSYHEGRGLKENNSSPPNVARLPDTIFVVNEDRCYGCAACVALCPVDALFLQGWLAIVDEPICTHCELCLAACPVHALSLEPNKKMGTVVDEVSTC